MARFTPIPTLLVLGALLALPAPLRAQQPAPAQQPAAKPVQAQPAKSEEPADPAEKRLRRIEEQLLDVQAMIGTLQSLVVSGKTSAGGEGTVAPPPRTQPGAPAASGGLSQRVDVIETQIRALSSQMEQITRQLGGGQGSVPNAQQGFQQGAPQQQPVPQQPGAAPVPPQSAVQPAPQQPGQRLGAINQGQQPAQQAAPQQQVATVPETPQSRAAYEAAYGHLLRRDFASAEKGFNDFLKTYPNDALAGNAQYWLGETFYVRGQFREAADTFLSGYRKYKSSDKAPANLLKLGMSLHQLGEKDAACATFEELSAKFPRAPQHLKQRASTESRRSGC
jgi:tol-pal system protein YbgF